MAALPDGGIPTRLCLLVSRLTHKDREIRVTRTTRLVAKVLTVGACTFLFSALSVSAAGGPPGLHETGSRIEDTASPDAFAADLARAFRQFQARRLPGAQRQAGSGPAQINLIFHVLSGQAMEGDVSDAVLLAQVAVLNEAYRTTGLHFNVTEIRRYPQSVYFAGGCFPTTEQGIRMKSELAVDPARYVNIYTCKLALPYIAGYATLPNEFPEGDHRHGVIIDYGTLPGSAAPLDLGHTLVHELGHYFGLFHTFQGGCAEPGDGVADTPAEASAAYGCQIGRDTCAEAGTDPIDNFMDYSDDSCTSNFTSLQAERMQAAIAAFRPSLVSTVFSIGAGITGNWFNPAQDGHGFSIEVLAGNRMLADWYVYAPNGGPVWIFATGTINGNSAVLQGFQKMGNGGRFPPSFDPSQLQSLPWGTLVFTFTDCNNGQVSWQPVVAGYTGGSMPITRLTMPAGLSCP